jgi:RimJ/RimL family protein N-acetyltransferase
MAFVAVDEANSEILGVVWLYSDSVHETGEYAILLISDLKGRGLGWALMQLIIEYAKSEGLKQISGQILQENSVMLKMCRELGFEVKTDAERPRRVRCHSRARRRVNDSKRRRALCRARSGQRSRSQQSR